MKFFRSFRFTHYKAGNGSKQLGLLLWWNGSRRAAEFNFGIHQFTVMKEKW